MTESITDSTTDAIPLGPRHTRRAAPLLASTALAAAAVVAALACLSSVSTPARANELHRYADADIPLGERLIQEHRCAECHTRRVGGDGSAIYRPKGRINTPAALRGMVDYCAVELKMSLFPEEVTAIAAVLQRDHYRFPATPAR
jgi:mono/diheme cytochrome c family protein